MCLYLNFVCLRGNTATVSGLKNTLVHIQPRVEVDPPQKGQRGGDSSSSRLIWQHCCLQLKRFSAPE